MDVASADAETIIIKLKDGVNLNVSKKRLVEDSQEFRRLIDEEGQDATYEVEFRVVGFWNTRAANVMRRNGVIFYSDK